MSEEKYYGFVISTSQNDFPLSPNVDDFRLAYYMRISTLKEAIHLGGDQILIFLHFLHSKKSRKIMKLMEIGYFLSKKTHFKKCFWFVL